MKKTQTILRKAFIVAKGQNTFATIKNLKIALAEILGEPVTEARLLNLIKNNESIYRIALEIRRNKSDESVRYNGRNVSVIGVFPKDVVEGDKLFV